MAQLVNGHVVEDIVQGGKSSREGVRVVLLVVSHPVRVCCACRLLLSSAHMLGVARRTRGSICAATYSRIMSFSTALTPDSISKFRARFVDEDRFRLAQNLVSKSDPLDACLTRKAVESTNHVFNTKVRLVS